jgi:hypothetical protein
MGSRLVNVRLDEARLRKIQALRRKGIAISDVVRAAIDERYHKAFHSRGPRDVRAIFERLDAEFPIGDKDLPARKYDVHDLRQAAAAIRKRLARRAKNGAKRRRGG